MGNVNNIAKDAISLKYGLLCMQVEEYIATGGSDVPLLVLGGEGSGKTSVMTTVGSHLQAKLDQLPK